ncbi:4-phosphopantoate--beta-alanine ligase [Microvirga terricola]|nr:pantoate--beta-alanine ligase [Microvirga terricola]
MPAPVIDNVSALRKAVSEWRRESQTIALVPTRRALHEGHLSLVRIARQEANRVIVSLLPDHGIDMARKVEESSRKLSGLADIVFAPPLSTMVREREYTTVTLSGPAEAGLEDRFDPDHFRGAATMAAKLFNLAHPDIAVLGEKHYQELLVVRRMTEDLHFPVRIVSGPILREAGGLAVSARNRHLSKDHRAHAAILFQTLKSCAEGLSAGDAMADVLEAGWAVLSKADFKVDYLDARDALTLAPASQSSGSLRLFVAARLGATRLIDNVAIPQFSMQSSR